MAVLALLLTATTVYAAPLATANGFSREVVTGDATIGIMYEGMVGANVRHGIVDGIARVSDGEVLLVDQLVSLTGDWAYPCAVGC